MCNYNEWNISHIHKLPPPYTYTYICYNRASCTHVRYTPIDLEQKLANAALVGEPKAQKEIVKASAALAGMCVCEWYVCVAGMCVCGWYVCV